ncbi:MAG: response regulator [Cyanothece sp. SIO2G6]|nr:response regulator [Cyanothece sp. SIO2G6]
MEQAIGYKLAEWFEVNQKTQFTGKILACSHTEQQWAIYFLFGRVIWASGGSHRFRRWFRLLTAHIPELAPQQLPLPDTSSSRLWEYSVLRLLLKQRKALIEPVSHLIAQSITEVTFEILQEATDIQQSDYGARRIKRLGDPIAVFRPDQCFQKAYEQWTQWRQAGLISYSPNLAPFLRYPDQLKLQLAENTYTKLATLLTGNRSLRGLASYLDMDLLALSKALLPFVNQGIISLNLFPDWVPPATTAKSVELSSESEPSDADASNRPLILGIDDSPSVCKLLEQIMSQGGYRFLSVQDSFQALPMVLKYKPDFIFLDLTMPVASGYEVCAQIRRIAAFQSIPIVILSGNDGMVDRVRAKLVGASDFLSKPFQPQEVLGVVSRYLAISATKITRSSMVGQYH